MLVLLPAAPDGKGCRHCGRENEAHYEFCLGCGEELQDGPAPPISPGHRGALVHEQFFGVQPARPAASSAGVGLWVAVAALWVVLAGAIAWLLL